MIKTYAKNIEKVYLLANLKEKKVKFIREIAVQAWNACKKEYGIEQESKLKEAVLNRKYWMDNPSAWEKFSQEGSDFIREFVEIAEGQ